MLLISIESPWTQILISVIVRSSYGAKRFDQKSVCHFQAVSFHNNDISIAVHFSIVTMRYQSLVVTIHMFLFPEDNNSGLARK